MSTPYLFTQKKWLEVLKNKVYCNCNVSWQSQYIIEKNLHLTLRDWHEKLWCLYKIIEKLSNRWVFMPPSLDGLFCRSWCHSIYSCTLCVHSVRRIIQLVNYAFCCGDSRTKDYKVLRTLSRIFFESGSGIFISTNTSVDRSNDTMKCWTPFFWIQCRAPRTKAFSPSRV